MVASSATAAAATAAAIQRDGFLQLHKRHVGRRHVWRGGARAGDLRGHFLLQAERQGLEGLWTRVRRGGKMEYMKQWGN